MWDCWQPWPWCDRGGAPLHTPEQPPCVGVARLIAGRLVRPPEERDVVLVWPSDEQDEHEARAAPDERGEAQQLGQVRGGRVSFDAPVARRWDLDGGGARSARTGMSMSCRSQLRTRASTHATCRDPAWLRSHAGFGIPSKAEWLWMNLASR